MAGAHKRTLSKDKVSECLGRPYDKDIEEQLSREAALNAWVADVEGMLEEGMVQVRELKLELAAAKQELVATRQEALELRHESEQAKAMAVQANDKYMLSLKEKEKALRQKELLLRQIQLERFERGGGGE